MGKSISEAIGPGGKEESETAADRRREDAYHRAEYQKTVAVCAEFHDDLPTPQADCAHPVPSSHSTSAVPVN